MQATSALHVLPHVELHSNTLRVLLRVTGLRVCVCVCVCVLGVSYACGRHQFSFQKMASIHVPLVLNVMVTISPV